MVSFEPIIPREDFKTLWNTYNFGDEDCFEGFRRILASQIAGYGLGSGSRNLLKTLGLLPDRCGKTTKLFRELVYTSILHDIDILDLIFGPIPAPEDNIY